jgi:hypothetical protein
LKSINSLLKFLCSKIHSSPHSCIPNFSTIFWEFFPIISATLFSLIVFLKLEINFKIDFYFPLPFTWPSGHLAQRTDPRRLNSDLNLLPPPPPLFTLSNRRLRDPALMSAIESPAPPPPSGPYKRPRPSPDLHRTHLRSPPLLSTLKRHLHRAPPPPPLCRHHPAASPPLEPG